MSSLLIQKQPMLIIFNSEEKNGMAKVICDLLLKLTGNASTKRFLKRLVTLTVLSDSWQAEDKDDVENSVSKECPVENNLVNVELISNTENLIPVLYFEEISCEDADMEDTVNGEVNDADILFQGETIGISSLTNAVRPTNNNTQPIEMLNNINLKSTSVGNKTFPLKNSLNTIDMLFTCKECRVNFTTEAHFYRHMVNRHEFRADDNKANVVLIEENNQKVHIEPNNQDVHFENNRNVNIDEDNWENDDEEDNWEMDDEEITLNETVNQDVSASCKSSTNGNARVTCKHCGITFATLQSLRRHIKRRHKTRSVKFTCKVCHANLTTENRYANHMASRHVSCKHCGITCATLQSLHRHIKRRHEATAAALADKTLTLLSDSWQAENKDVVEKSVSKECRVENNVVNVELIEEENLILDIEEINWEDSDREDTVNREVNDADIPLSKSVGISALASTSCPTNSNTQSIEILNNINLKSTSVGNKTFPLKNSLNTIDALFTCKECRVNFTTEAHFHRHMVNRHEFRADDNKANVVLIEENNQKVHIEPNNQDVHFENNRNVNIDEDNWENDDEEDNWEMDDEEITLNKTVNKDASTSCKRSTNGNTRVTCEHCSIMCATLSSLRRHIKRRHKATAAASGDKAPVKFTCKVCHTSFTTEIRYSHHMASRHVSCKHCGITCATLQSLHRHIKRRHEATADKMLTLLSDSLQAEDKDDVENLVSKECSVKNYIVNVELIKKKNLILDIEEINEEDADREDAVNCKVNDADIPLGETVGISSLTNAVCPTSNNTQSIERLNNINLKPTSMCDKTFPCKNSLETIDTLFTCKVCRANFATEAHFDRHMVNQHEFRADNNRVNVELIEKNNKKVLIEPNNRDVHLEENNRNVNNEKVNWEDDDEEDNWEMDDKEITPVKFTCKVCHANFTKEIRYAHHLASRHVSCEYCGITCATLQTLHRHIKRRHEATAAASGDKTPVKFTCKVCHANFTTEIRYAHHMASRHVSCEHCGITCATLQILRRHMKHRHEATAAASGDTKKHSCNICGKKFLELYSLKRHTMQTHLREKEWVCSVCGKLVGSPGNYKRHLRTHTGDRPFDCKVCGKRFVNNLSLKEHLHAHSEDKPYVCMNCDRGYASARILKRHLCNCKPGRRNLVKPKNALRRSPAEIRT